MWIEYTFGNGGFTEVLSFILEKCTLGWFPYLLYLYDVFKKVQHAHFHTGDKERYCKRVLLFTLRGLTTLLSLLLVVGLVSKSESQMEEEGEHEERSR